LEGRLGLAIACAVLSVFGQSPASTCLKRERTFDADFFFLSLCT
jgi:hypothetical protein